MYAVDGGGRGRERLERRPGFGRDIKLLFTRFRIIPTVRNATMITGFFLLKISKKER